MLLFFSIKENKINIIYLFDKKNDFGYILKFTIILFNKLLNLQKTTMLY